MKGPHVFIKEDKICIDAITITASHLSKLYWPDLHLTKKDVLTYYAGVGKYLLPFIKDRPLSLHRFPDGINAEGFYQKNFSSYDNPSWFKTKVITAKSAGKPVEYAVGDEMPGLLYLVNLGAIEFHAWHSRIMSLNYPDYLIVDLDPVQIEFSAVLKVALYFKEMLDRFGLRSYCKTTGSRGLHVYVLLDGKKPYSFIRQFAEKLVRFVVNQFPSETSVERAPSKRIGKVYLDYLQNNFGQTAVVPYSLRPLKNAPVATPLDWNEVNEKLSSCTYNIHTISARLSKYAHVWRDFFSPVSPINYVKILSELK